MAATFNAAARVKVTDQHSEFRNKLGTVISRSGNDHQVRLDGFPAGATKLFIAGELGSTTLPSPIDYSNAS